MSARSSPRRRIPTAACSGGFATTVLPPASAEAALLQNMPIGMLNGMIAATTP